MSEQTSRLAIILDSSGAKRNAESLTDALVRLTTGGEKTVAAVGKLGVALGTAVAAGALSAASAVAVMVKQTAEAGVEISRFSKIANTSTTDFQKYAVAASAAGISQEKLSDIMKDVNDKVGDFLSTGGGELQNFFTQIAPKVGVTAKQFENLSGPQAMQLYVSSLEKANVSQAQMTFYMEAIANDATALIPMFQNGGKAAGELGDMAQRLGLILDQKTIAAAQQMETTGWLVTSSFQGMRNQIAAGLMPVLSDLASDMVGYVAHGVDMSAVSETLEDWLKKLAKAAVTAAGAFMGVSKGMSGMVDLWNGVKDIDLSHPIDAYGKIKDVYANVSKETDSQLGDIESWVSKSLDAINKAGDTGGNELIKNLTKWRNEANQFSQGSYFPGANGQQKKGGNQVDSGAKMIQQLTEQRNILLQQDKTGQSIGSQEQASIKWATQLADLKQKKNLTADEKSLLIHEKTITALANQNVEIEKAIKLQEQQQKITAFHQQLGKETSQFTDSLNAQLAGGGLGSKQQQRAQELLALQQEFNQKQGDLTDRFNDKSSGMTPEMYQQETALISQELQKRTGFLQNYYTKADAMESNWQAGVMNSLHNFVDQNSDYMTMASQATSDILNGLSSSISDNFTSILNGTESFKKGMSNLVSELGQTVIHTLIQMAVQAAITKAIMGIGGSLFGGASAGNAGTAISGGGESLSLGANIPSFAGSLTGMAHSGIDSVPNTGTWLLEKGERVMTSQTSARLDSTLDHIKRKGLDATLSNPRFSPTSNNVNNSNKTSNTQHLTQHITVQGGAGNDTAALVQQAARQGAEQGYRRVVADVTEGKGHVSKALKGAWNTDRKIG